MKNFDDKAIIREQGAAIDIVLEYLDLQIERLSIIRKETDWLKNYTEAVKIILDNVKNPDKDYLV